MAACVSDGSAEFPVAFAVAEERIWFRRGGVVATVRAGGQAAGGARRRRGLPLATRRNGVGGGALVVLARLRHCCRGHWQGASATRCTGKMPVQLGPRKMASDGKGRRLQAGQDEGVLAKRVDWGMRSQVADGKCRICSFTLLEFRFLGNICKNTGFLMQQIFRFSTI